MVGVLKHITRDTQTQLHTHAPDSKSMSEVQNTCIYVFFVYSLYTYQINWIFNFFCVQTHTHTRFVFIPLYIPFRFYWLLLLLLPLLFLFENWNFHLPAFVSSFIFIYSFLVFTLFGYYLTSIGKHSNQCQY